MNQQERVQYLIMSEGISQLDALKLLKQRNYVLFHAIDDIQATYPQEVRSKARSMLQRVSAVPSNLFLLENEKTRFLAELGFNTQFEQLIALYWAREHNLTVFGVRRLVNFVMSNQMNRPIQQMTKEQFLFCINHFLREGHISGAIVFHLLKSFNRISDYRGGNIMIQSKALYTKSECLQLWDKLQD